MSWCEGMCENARLRLLPEIILTPAVPGASASCQEEDGRKQMAEGGTEDNPLIDSVFKDRCHCDPGHAFYLVHAGPECRSTLRDSVIDLYVLNTVCIIILLSGHPSFQG